MHTLLPHSAPKIPPINIRRTGKSAACGWRCRWRDAGDYITARPKPVGGSRLVCTGGGWTLRDYQLWCNETSFTAAVNPSSGTKRAPDRADGVL